MKSSEIRSRFLRFFEKRGHRIIPSAPLVPQNDPTVLFNTAGMQPLVPYLLGATHPEGRRLVNVQKCVRTQDIDEVGDNTHDTFFEMLGNWSLGEYFKEDAIRWSYEFLTSREEGLGLDPDRLYITVFEGDENAPRDTESAEIWKKCGVPENRIYFMGASSNWWSVGDNGPCGPDTEMFYDVSDKGLNLSSRKEFLKLEETKDQRLIEIWNDVFMEYMKRDGKVVGKLDQQNVDTGAGLERIAAVMQGTNNIFSTDLFQPILDKINEFSTAEDVRAQRIVADHLRTSVFIIADGVTPSNTDQGYVLRRLIRRAVLHADKLGMRHGSLFWIAETIVEMYKEIYPELKQAEDLIKSEIDKEEQKFRRTIQEGIRKAADLPRPTGQDAFDLYQSHGLPFELTKEIIGKPIEDEGRFFTLMEEHRELSRSGASQKFKGGLADTSEMSVKYHTATHLLNAALREVLGNEIIQKGSNITPERLRFDFTYSSKMTEEQKKQVEDIVNRKIEEDLPVSFQEMPKEEAEKTGAVHAFGEKYGDVVKVYSIGDEKSGFFSREFCGGPHVEHTGTLGKFKIIKAEAVSAGVRRIKAILE